MVIRRIQEATDLIHMETRREAIQILGPIQWTLVGVVLNIWLSVRQHRDKGRQ